MDLEYLSTREVIFIHIMLVKWDPGEAPNDGEIRAIREELLDSAVNVIKHDYYSGVYMKAAALFRSLVKNHAFVDGNKRTAVLAVDVFLGINGYDFRPDQQELVKFTLKVAKGYVKNLGEIKSWIKKRTRRMEPQSAQEFQTKWARIRQLLFR